MGDTQNNSEESNLDVGVQLDLNFCGLKQDQELFNDLSKNQWNGKLAGSEKKTSIGVDDVPNNLFANYLILDNPNGTQNNNFENNYVKIDRDIIFDCPKGITVEAWVKLRRINGWYYRIFDFGGNLNPQDNTIVNITIESSSDGSEPNKGGFTFYLHRKPGNATGDDRGDTDPSRIYMVKAPYRSINENQWTHLAVVANFVERSSKFFVNARLVGENTNPYRENTYNRVNLSRDNRIGATAKNDSRTGAPLDGGIAHLRLYSRPLSQAEIFKRMAVKLFPTLDSSASANALESLDNKTLATVLTSLDPSKIDDKELADTLKKMKEDILATRNDTTWESLKVLFDLKNH